MIVTSVLCLAKDVTNWAGNEDIVLGLSRKTAPHGHGQTEITATTAQTTRDGNGVVCTCVSQGTAKSRVLRRGFSEEGRGNKSQWAIKKWKWRKRRGRQAFAVAEQ